MSPAEGRNVGRFRRAEAEQNFLRAFDTAMVSWPERMDQMVDTGFGPTMVSRAAGASDSSGGALPAILLPGGGSTIAVWGPFVEEWSHDREVIAVDSVWDAGRSTQTRPVLTPSDTETWLDDVLNGLGIEEVHLVGYSYGAWVALNQAVESTTSSVTRVVSVTAVEPPQALAGMPPGAWWKLLRMLLGNDKKYRSYLRWIRGGRMSDSDTLDLLLAARAGFEQRGSPRPRRITDQQWETLRKTPDPGPGHARRPQSPGAHPQGGGCRRHLPEYRRHRLSRRLPRAPRRRTDGRHGGGS